MITVTLSGSNLTVSSDPETPMSDPDEAADTLLTFTLILTLLLPGSGFGMWLTLASMRLIS